jgi:putative aminopeptidase FrvX
MECGTGAGKEGTTAEVAGVNQESLLQILRELLPAHSPGGDEGEIDRILLPRFRECCQDVEQDAAENIVGVIRGAGERPPHLVAAHKDELGMIVKRIEPDGLLRVQEIGGAYPWKYGEGMVDILAPGGVIQGVMGIGSLHTTEETPSVERARTAALEWSMVRVFTRRTREELEALGVGPGTRVVVARERKAPVLLRDCVCGYAIDDKAALAVMLDAMQQLAAGQLPPGDIYFAATSTEEQSGLGAPALARRLPVESMLALEIGPVEPEYGLELDDRPIIWYKDRLVTYTKSFCDELVAVGARIGIGTQRAVYSRAVTDASACRQTGQVGRVAVLSFPTLNSHGYEVAPVEGILNMSRLLLAYLRETCGVTS